MFYGLWIIERVLWSIENVLFSIDHALLSTLTERLGRRGLGAAALGAARGLGGASPPTANRKCEIKNWRGWYPDMTKSLLQMQSRHRLAVPILLWLPNWVFLHHTNS